jgi:dolichyl-phosphate-mannose--protein O-mannosyl transferase
LPQPSPQDLLLACMFGLGIYLRTRAFDVPATFLFDEHHFVDNARNYLAHRLDENDHPPLGKLVIAAFIRILGDRPLGWRAGALVTGFLIVVVAGFAAARLFRSARAGWVAAALIAADGFFIAYSRVALLDGFLVLAAASCLWFCTTSLRLPMAAAAGVAAGAAMSIKFSGVGVLPALLLAIALTSASRPAKAARAGVLVSIALGTYCGSYALGLFVARQPHSVTAVAKDTWRLLLHHAALTEMSNPWSSGWITWAVPVRPILLGETGHTGAVQSLTSLGNLAVWWSAIVLGAAIASVIGWRGLRATLADHPTSTSHARLEDPAADRSCRLGAFTAAHGRAVITVLTLSAGLLSPWVLTHRESYLYHFLPVYLGLVVLVAGYAAWVAERRPGLLIAFLAVVLAVAGFYAPVWSMIPLTPRALEARLVLPSWR